MGIGRRASRPTLAPRACCRHGACGRGGGGKHCRRKCVVGAGFRREGSASDSGFTLYVLAGTDLDAPAPRPRFASWSYPKVQDTTPKTADLKTKLL